MAINNPVQGVRKINELTVQKGRALVLTEDSDNIVKFSDVPYGTMKINSKTGIMSVKVKGYSNWVQYALRSPDGTLAIIKDERVVIERYYISRVAADGQNFECYRRIPLFNNEGQETGEYEDIYRTFRREEGGFLFELEDAMYQPGKNHICVILDDCLYRDAVSGGIKEWSEKAVLVKDQLVEGQKITIKYQTYVKVGNPAPRMFLTSSDPDNYAEVGDIWLDYNGTLNDNESMGENIETRKTIRWDQVINTPTNIEGYGIIDAAPANHTHTMDQIEGLEEYFQTRIRSLESDLAVLEATVAATKLKKGPKGDDATIRIGTVSTGSASSVVNVGTEQNAVFNFTLVKGDRGAQGETGPKGDQGITGPKGVAGRDGIDGIDGMTYSDLATSAQNVYVEAFTPDLEGLHALPLGFSARYATQGDTNVLTLNQCCMYIIKRGVKTGVFIGVPSSNTNLVVFGYFDNTVLKIKAWN